MITKTITKILPRSIRNKLERNPELRKIITNINWLFLDKIIQMGIAFFVGVWVIRYLGPEKYGILSYAVAVTAIFSIFSNLGLEMLSVKEFVNNKISKESIFGTVFFMKLMGGILVLFFSLLTILFTKGSETIFLIIVLIISFSFIIKPFDVIDYWFQFKVISKYSAYARGLASVLSALLKIILILTNAPLVFFAITIFIETAIFILGIIIFYKKNKQSIRLWKLDFSLALNFLKNAWPLALASLSAIIYMRIDQIMIGNMLGDKFLGNYSVAVNLSEIWYFVPTIIAGSVFPAILYSKKISQKLYLKRLQILYDSMFWIAFLIAVPVSFFSSQIISFLYGPEFSQASLVLSIYIWAGIAVFLGGANNKFLIAENLFSIFFYRSIIGMTVNIFLNLFFIPKYGIAGAGLATLISYFVVTFSVIFFKKSRESALFFINTLNIFRIIRMILNIKENYKTK